MFPTWARPHKAPPDRPHRGVRTSPAAGGHGARPKAFRSSTFV
jgi:hypothetical protein